MSIFPWNRSTAAQAIEVTELNDRDARKALREQFGQDDGFALTEPDWGITETEADSVLGKLSPRSTLRAEFLP